LFFTENGFVKPKIRRKTKKKSGLDSAFSVLQTLISFCGIYEACPLGELLFYAKQKIRQIFCRIFNFRFFKQL